VAAKRGPKNIKKGPDTFTRWQLQVLTDSRKCIRPLSILLTDSGSIKSIAAIDSSWQEIAGNVAININKH